jgi:hypothetical protein
MPVGGAFLVLQTVINLLAGDPALVTPAERHLLVQALVQLATSEEFERAELEQRPIE